MKIETKKNIGDVVFFLHKENNKIQSAPISKIYTESENSDSGIDTEVKYWVKVLKSGTDWEYKTLKENEVFDSREQLIESL